MVDAYTALTSETIPILSGSTILVPELMTPVWLSLAILFSFYFVWVFSDLIEWLIKQLFKLIDFISKL